MCGIGGNEGGVAQGMDREDWRILGIGLLLAVLLGVVNGIVAGAIYWIITTFLF